MNYTELQSAVSNWLHRDNLTVNIPDFISLVETRLNRSLRIPDMITSVTITPASFVYALPTDFLEVQSVFIDEQRLEYSTPELNYNINMYTIRGGNIIIQSETDMELIYYAKISKLSVTNTTNWWGDNAEDAMLFGALLESAPFILNDQRIPVWGDKFSQAIEEIKAYAQKALFPEHSLETKTIRQVIRQ